MNRVMAASAFLVLSLAGCADDLTVGTGTATSESGSSSRGDDDGDGEPPNPLDDALTLDHVQVKATHNSYHLEPFLPLDASHAYSTMIFSLQARA